MKAWTITAIGEAREIYNVSADTEGEAREMFERGEVSGPFLTEVSGSEITDIEEGE